MRVECLHKPVWLPDYKIFLPPVNDVHYLRSWETVKRRWDCRLVRTKKTYNVHWVRNIYRSRRFPSAFLLDLPMALSFGTKPNKICACGSWRIRNQLTPNGRRRFINAHIGSTEFTFLQKIRSPTLTTHITMWTPRPPRFPTLFQRCGTTYNKTSNISKWLQDSFLNCSNSIINFHSINKRFASIKSSYFKS